MKRSGKYVASVVFCAVVCIGLHVVTSLLVASLAAREVNALEGGLDTTPAELSSIALQLGMPLTGFLWALLAYGCVAFVFYRLQAQLPGQRQWRGLRYGTAIGGLWLLGYLMRVPKVGSRFSSEVIGGLSDALPVVVLGCLLAWIEGNPETIAGQKRKQRPFSLRSVVIFAAFFAVARLVAYSLNWIEVGAPALTPYALLWLVSMGCWLGLTYHAVAPVVFSAVAAWQRAMQFGVFVFGLTWGSFILFFPLMLSGHVQNTVLMFLLDVVAVTAAYHVVEVRWLRPAASDFVNI